MEERETGLRSQEQQSYQASAQRNRGPDQHFVKQLPWWRSSLFGYLMCPVLAGLTSLFDLSIRWSGLKIYSTGASFFLASGVLIAWLWGVGPALLGIVLGCLALYVVILPPYGEPFTHSTWSYVAIYVPFILAQLFVVLITAQLERAKQRSFVSEQRAQLQAQELTEVNQVLAQSNQQLAQVNSRLAEVNQLKDYFLSQASHELKTPITTIRGHTQLILRRLARSQRAVTEQVSLPTHLERIEEQTQRLQSLIEDLLDISSLNAGKIPLRLVQCNIGDLCRKVVEDQRILTDRHIELELPSEPLLLEADPQRLTQVILNLVSNAIKYSPADSVVRVGANQDCSHLILTVHNDGHAISPEQQIHIFEPFYRTPEVELSSTQGVGLGLAISKEIVERHDGRIGVESSDANGTTFFVELPLRITCSMAMGA